MARRPWRNIFLAAPSARTESAGSWPVEDAAPRAVAGAGAPAPTPPDGGSGPRPPAAGGGGEGGGGGGAGGGAPAPTPPDGGSASHPAAARARQKARGRLRFIVFAKRRGVGSEIPFP